MAARSIPLRCISLSRGIALVRQSTANSYDALWPPYHRPPNPSASRLPLAKTSSTRKSNVKICPRKPVRARASHSRKLAQSHGATSQPGVFSGGVPASGKYSFLLRLAWLWRSANPHRRMLAFKIFGGWHIRNLHLPLLVRSAPGRRRSHARALPCSGRTRSRPRSPVSLLCPGCRSIRSNAGNGRFPCTRGASHWLSAGHRPLPSRPAHCGGSADQKRWHPSSKGCLSGVRLYGAGYSEMARCRAAGLPVRRRNGGERLNALLLFSTLNWFFSLPSCILLS